MHSKIQRDYGMPRETSKKKESNKKKNNKRKRKINLKKSDMTRSNRIEYRGSFVRVFFYLLSINLMLFAIFLFTSKNFKMEWIFFGLINIFYVSTIINKPFKIVIDRDRLTIEIYSVLSKFTKPTIVHFNEVECTYDYERLPRGAKAKMLKIKHQSVVLVE